MTEESSITTHFWDPDEKFHRKLYEYNDPPIDDIELISFSVSIPECEDPVDDEDE
jgi:hypothetical protein